MELHCAPPVFGSRRQLDERLQEHLGRISNMLECPPSKDAYLKLMFSSLSFEFECSSSSSITCLVALPSSLAAVFASLETADCAEWFSFSSALILTALNAEVLLFVGDCSSIDLLFVPLMFNRFNGIVTDSSIYFCLFYSVEESPGAKTIRLLYMSGVCSFLKPLFNVQSLRRLERSYNCTLKK